MLTKDCFLPAFIQLSHPASLLTSIGFKWDSKSSKVVKLSPNKLRWHKITSYLHTFSIAIVFLQSTLARERNLANVMISSFAFIIICFCTTVVRMYNRDLYKCIALINDLISTAKELRDPGAAILDTKEKFIKLLAPTFHWSAMAVPFAFVGGVIWTMPCMTSNFGFFLLKECSPLLNHYDPSVAYYLDKMIKFIFLFTNLWIWSYGVQCAVFVVIGVVMLGAMSIRSFLKYYERKMIETIACKTDQNKRILQNTLLFRRLQLITGRFNAIHQSRILIPLLVTVTSHQVFGVYGIIKFKGQLNFVSYAFFGILASQGVLVIMGMFSALADVCTMSVRVKRNLEKAHRSHKYLSRFHKACPLIKIRFGALNYINSFTPLAFENFAVIQTTNILLVD